MVRGPVTWCEYLCSATLPSVYSTGRAGSGRLRPMKRAPNLAGSGNILRLEFVAPPRIVHSRMGTITRGLWDTLRGHGPVRFVSYESRSRTRVRCRTVMPTLRFAEVEWCARARPHRSLYANCTRPQWRGAIQPSADSYYEILPLPRTNPSSPCVLMVITSYYFITLGWWYQVVNFNFVYVGT